MKTVFYRNLLLNLCAIGFACSLCGCKPQEKPVLADYLLTQDNTTSKAIKTGHTAAEVLQAYDGYTFQYSEDTVNFLPFSEETCDLTGNFSLLLSSYYIDGTAYSAYEITETFGFDKEQVITSLKSASFLSDHQVSYSYLLFHFEQGIVTDITSETIDYNAEFAN